jgi:hypothetical protein
MRQGMRFAAAKLLLLQHVNLISRCKPMFLQIRVRIVVGDGLMSQPPRGTAFSDVSLEKEVKALFSSLERNRENTIYPSHSSHLLSSETLFDHYSFATLLFLFTIQTWSNCRTYG